MQMAQYVPSKAFTLWHRILRFFVTQTAPVLASSGALFRQMSSRSGETTGENHLFLDTNWRGVERDYGVSRAEQAELLSPNPSLHVP